MKSEEYYCVMKCDIDESLSKGHTAKCIAYLEYYGDNFNPCHRVGSFLKGCPIYVGIFGIEIHNKNPQTNTVEFLRFIGSNFHRIYRTIFRLIDFSG